MEDKMVFWKKKDALTKSDEASDKVGRYTEALRRSAITKHNPTEALVLLAGAAGAQAAALFLEHRGSVAIEDLIKAGCDTLRNNGYLRAGLIPPNLSVASSSPQNERKNLTEEQFKELSLHIVDEADQKQYSCRRRD
jgi:hypothetical protein